MALTWSGRRKLIYYGVGIVVLALLAWVMWLLFFNVAPSCFDGKQNEGELGIDCGGPCSLLCADTARDPVLLWSRAFQTGPTSYTAAAYIQNNNPGAGAKNVAYSFQLFDANNNLVIERDGVATLPPITTIPIIEPNIVVGNRTVARTQFAFSNTPPAVWSKVPANSIPTLSVAEQNLNADASRLSATVVNDTLNDAQNVTVAAVLFDSAGVARAASKSLIVDVPAKSSMPVVFTWGSGVPNIVRAEITILPSF
ncbi:MAG TPA: hypothetical protein VMR46_03640 [Candidatus Paceibacterota bacterium]|nr:hypothetical protein [Candidatus Paceibacterota bacterium]